MTERSCEESGVGDGQREVRNYVLKTGPNAQQQALGCLFQDEGVEVRICQPRGGITMAVGTQCRYVRSATIQALSRRLQRWWWLGWGRCDGEGGATASGLNYMYKKVASVCICQVSASLVASQSKMLAPDVAVVIAVVSWLGDLSEMAGITLNTLACILAYHEEARNWSRLEKFYVRL